MSEHDEAYSVEQYRMLELDFQGPTEGNPYADVELTAEFTSRVTGEQVRVGGFYRGHGRYAIRFMPSVTGEWTYATRSNSQDLNSQTGSITVTPAAGNNHGRVLLAGDVLRGEARRAYGAELQYRFCYEDGTPYQPYGTTSYAWVSQPADVQERTLATLARSPFNKIRMCVFPKYYDFNTTDPWAYAYQGSKETGFDRTRFNEEFFTNLDHRIEQLDELGIEADIILLHPYDQEEWGFSMMSEAEDDHYLRYMARRYGACKNVWWSLANEYDILLDRKPLEAWRRYARVIMANDAFNHLRSIHNCVTVYDYNEPWCTHCSMQRTEMTRVTELTDEWRKLYGKPVVYDEVGYEGNIYWGWGNLTGEEMTRRCWEGMMRGGYVTHGETFIDHGPQIWWSHGGELYGDSPDRIGFMRGIFADAPCDAAPLGEQCPSKWTWPVSNSEGTVMPATPVQEKNAQYWDIPILRVFLLHWRCRHDRAFRI